jgi:hypothetical protein
MLRLRRKSSAKWRRSDRLPKSRPELQIRIMQLDREGSPPPGLRLPQAKLSRKSNQVARGRIRQFESFSSLSGRVGVKRFQTAPSMVWDVTRRVLASLRDRPVVISGGAGRNK